MAKCVKCGHDPNQDSCPHCGYPARNAMVVEGEAVYICCSKPLFPKTTPKTPRGGK
jgi:hypothetical protein